MTAPYYSDDSVTLYHGDCREITEWLAADVLVTDPPYGIGWSRGTNKRKASKSHSGIQNDEDTSCRDAALDLWGTAKPGVVFGSWAAPFPAYKQLLVWRKPPDSGVVGSTTGYRRDSEPVFLIGEWLKRPPSRSSVIETNAGLHTYIRHGDHPHAKPVGLLERLMEWTSGAVADPFAGSGSTLVAAKAMGKPSIGVELEERYCEIIAKRLDQGVLDFNGAA